MVLKKDRSDNAVKRAVFFWGLLFCVAAAGASSVLAWVETIRIQDEAALGQLILLKPQTESDYVSVMRGKHAADRREAIRAGQNADQRYGYVGAYASLSPAAAAFLPIPLTLSALTAFLLGILLIVQQKRQSRLELEVFALEDRLTQAMGEAQTLKKKMEQEEKKTKALVTDVSHQLKTPLASLKMCYELADLSDLTQDEQRTFLIQGRQEVDRLEDLIHSLIQVSHLEANMIQIRRVRVSLREILQDAVNSIYMKAYERGIDISVDGSMEGEAFLDPHWTQEALVNILDNGIKYSEKGTAIQIRVRPMISHYLLEIEDEGIGIGREEAGRIFKRFYRGSSPKVQKTEGSGVGLYLTRKILEAQGGTICVKKGQKGSLFLVTIPFP